MFSSRLWMIVPRFLGRGRWFWGAWLLMFLWPATREEARLHFVGSRYFPRFYDQPWQERWMVDEDAPTPALSPLERAVWKSWRAENFNFYGQSTEPFSTPAGRILRQFPREKWLHALAMRQALGWNSGTGRYQANLINWARRGEQLDPGNAFYPLMLAKILGDSGRATSVLPKREAALRRAASCNRFDDGSTTLKAVGVRSCRKIGVATWSEEWQVWSQFGNSDGQIVNQMDTLLGQFNTLSAQDMSVARGPKTTVRSRQNAIRRALSRSNELMRVSLLLQSAPCGPALWRVGANYARGAWRTGRTKAKFYTPPEPTAREFIAFASAHSSAPNVRLAQKCAARIRLLAPSIGVSSPMNQSAMFSPIERFWVEAGSPMGFGVLFFGAYLLGWWWFLSMLLWRASGRESSPRARLVPATIVLLVTLFSFAVLTAIVMSWVYSPTLVRRGPPAGRAEVMAAWSLFSFFAPPLLLALWCAVRARFQNRAALSLPARQQIEMNLAPLDAWMLGRSLGVFALTFLGFAVGVALLWGYLRWNTLTGFDWLRFLLPGVSTRAVDPIFTSFDSPFMPTYAALSAITLALIWLFSWRYAVDPVRRPFFHDGLRAWKESLGCLLALTVWVYFALLVGCHVSGNVFSKRLDVAAARGEGAFVKGF